MGRLETGVVQDGDDWPGIFIRGDNAIAFSLALDALLSGRADRLGVIRCANLLKLLQKANVSEGVTPQIIHREGAA